MDNDGWPDQVTWPQPETPVVEDPRVENPKSEKFPHISRVLA